MRPLPPPPDLSDQRECNFSLGSRVYGLRLVLYYLFPRYRLVSLSLFVACVISRKSEIFFFFLGSGTTIYSRNIGSDVKLLEILK